jgi:hypothetical protein
MPVGSVNGLLYIVWPSVIVGHVPERVVDDSVSFTRGTTA